MNVPGECGTPSVSILEYLNSLLFRTSVTKKVPLYPLLSTPVALLEHFIFLTTTWSPTFTL